MAKRKKTRNRHMYWGWSMEYPPWEIGFYRSITHVIFGLYCTELEIWEWKFIRRFKRKNRTINEIKKQILC